MVHRKARGFGGDNDLPAKSCGANGGNGGSSGGFGSSGSSSSGSARGGGGGGVEGPTSNNGFLNNSGSKGGRSNGGDGGDDPDEDMDLDQFQCPDSPTQSWLAENADLSPLQVLDNISLKSGRI